jgi:hypothetical protein
MHCICILSSCFVYNYERNRFKVTTLPFGFLAPDNGGTERGWDSEEGLKGL